MAPYSNGRPNSLVSLKRWSAQSKDIPGVSSIKALHVYDFDNTLFSSPLPNPQLWNSSSIGHLQSYEAFANGGWWHAPSILASTGEGADKEEMRGWKGWWNEAIVQLVELSMQQKDALTVLLTGRSEIGFTDLIKRIIKSRKLEFDLVVLKPEVGPNGQHFPTTMDFKKEFLQDLVFTYKASEEIKIYEDRPRHTKGFRDFFERMNKSLLSHPVDQPAPVRKPITCDVIQVTELTQYLEPVTETTAIQRLINDHNTIVSSPQSASNMNKTRSPHPRLSIKRTSLYTAYMLSSLDSTRLLTLITSSLTPALLDAGEIKLLASSILISPKPINQVPQNILSKAGGLGKKVLWQVTGTGIWEDRVWAARLSPIGLRNGETIFTADNGPPVCVLAVRKGGRPADACRIQNWTPVDEGRGFVFESVVGEKVFLTLENETSDENHYDPYRNNKRKYANENGDGYNGRGNVNDGSSYRDRRRGGFSSRGGGGRNGNAQARGNRGDARNFSSNANQGGGGGGGRGKDRAGGAGRRGGGGQRGYKSLDDYGPGGNGYDGSFEARGGGEEGGVPVMNY